SGATHQAKAMAGLSLSVETPPANHRDPASANELAAAAAARFFVRYNAPIMLWSTLKEYGTGRWVRWSYFWLFFVPIAAKFLSDVQDIISFDLGNQHVELNMDLPFSWVLFYFGALAFALAYFIYFHACPALIRDFDEYSDYKAAGKGESYIRDVFFN